MGREDRDAVAEPLAQRPDDLGPARVEASAEEHRSRPVPRDALRQPALRPRARAPARAAGDGQRERAGGPLELRANGRPYSSSPSSST